MRRAFTVAPRNLPSFFPLGSKFLFFILVWMHSMCCLSIALVFTTISTRKPVVRSRSRRSLSPNVPTQNTENRFQIFLS